MFFFLSKTLGFFALPSNCLFALGVLGFLLLATRYARAGKRLLIAGALAGGLMWLLPFGTIFLLVLEQRFPPWDETRGAPDGIVILGGAIGPELSRARGQISLNDSAERLTIVAMLARRYPQARIVFSGGNGALISPEGDEAEFALKLLQSFGIEAARVTAENRSRNTAENAVFSKSSAAPKAGERWLLITSAFHMPRAIGTFRQAGFDVEAYPVDYRTEGWGDAWSFYGGVGEVTRVDFATHEWIGLLAYWLTGRTSALFPGP
jgi:uncharacterized SAM-binding protein YcdF (DUF218 family)